MQLTFNATTVSQTVMITITDGNMLERLETFNVTLTTSDTAVTINPMAAAVKIQESK